MRFLTMAFVITCALAALTPLLAISPGGSSNQSGEIIFPDHYQGRALQPIGMTKDEMAFYRNFPGEMAKFSDGRRSITFKWIHRPSRKVHPAADCFRGMGYAITPKPIHVDEVQQRWGAFSAVKGDLNLLVREQISSTVHGRWTDVSSWYWSALLGTSKGPWMVVTIVETQGRQPASLETQ